MFSMGKWRGRMSSVCCSHTSLLIQAPVSWRRGLWRRRSDGRSSCGCVSTDCSVLAHPIMKRVCAASRVRRTSFFGTSLGARAGRGNQKAGKYNCNREDGIACLAPFFVLLALQGSPFQAGWSEYWATYLRAGAVSRQCPGRDRMGSSTQVRVWVRCGRQFGCELSLCSVSSRLLMVHAYKCNIGYANRFVANASSNC